MIKDDTLRDVLRRLLRPSLSTYLEPASLFVGLSLQPQHGANITNHRRRSSTESERREGALPYPPRLYLGVLLDGEEIERILGANEDLVVSRRRACAGDD